MYRLLLLIVGIVLSGSLRAQSAPPELVGRIDGKSYVSPTGTFRVPIPVLPELGGRITDTENAVTFQDDFTVLSTIAAIPMDATQRWEFSTRELKDYLGYFFVNLVMPDFSRAFPGADIESSVYAPSVAGGALFTYTLLPGGSMFTHKLAFLDPNEKLPAAKRGNMVFVRDNVAFVISVELAERILEHSTWHKTPAEENAILRQRLMDLYSRMEFTKPATPVANP